MTLLKYLFLFIDGAMFGVVVTHYWKRAHPKDEEPWWPFTE